jgi:phospholipid/cholesterol/gamma-HCH transport system ATP-binding protein
MRRSIIDIKDLHKSYNGLQVLQGVDLDIKRGETITILGGSGTGKSVLLKLIAGLEKPRRKIGMLFQGAALFDSLSAGENVAYPIREHFRISEEEIHRIVREKLRMVGLEGIENKMPAELSGGMKKRVGLARAIAIDPEIILYDEPTTGLDPANTQRINQLIVELQRILKVTSIVVTHDLDSAYQVTDQLALLYRGRIAMKGTKEEFKASTIQEVQDFIAKKIIE